MMILSCSFFDSLPKNRDQKKLNDPFTKGYQLFSNRHYQQALPVFLTYLKNHNIDEDNYSWALFFFGICLKENGYTHAAFDIFTRLIEQSPNAKIVTHVLEFFESAISQGIITENQLQETVFCSKNFGYIDEPLSYFIFFQQGMCNWRKGYIEWGNQQFKKIPKNSIYYPQYHFELSRLMIHNNDIQKAIEILTSILHSDAITPSIKEKTRITLARLFYEQKKYDRSDELYQKIDKHHPEKSLFLLERAWTQYYSGYPDIAMGLLIGLKAPELENTITPEYFLLKALIYKQVCNYQKALSIVNEFQDQYHELIDHIKKRHQLSDQRQALQLLYLRKTIKQHLSLLNLLEHEKDSIQQLDNKPLAKYLENIYIVLINRYKNELQTIAKKEYERLSDQLLSFEENMRLMNYEIGLDMYQRVKQQTNSKKKEDSASIDNPVIYPFIHEYWNDELDDLRVSLPNRCQTLEEWDIFFK